MGLIMNKRVIKAIAQTERCTINTDSGFPPSFNATYDMGNIANKIPPITD